LFVRAEDKSDIHTELVIQHPARRRQVGRSGRHDELQPHSSDGHHVVHQSDVARTGCNRLRVDPDIRKIEHARLAVELAEPRVPDVLGFAQAPT